MQKSYYLAINFIAKNLENSRGGGKFVMVNIE